MIKPVLVLELKRDKDILNNQNKIDFINKIGKILTDAEGEDLTNQIIKELESSNDETCEELKANTLYFIKNNPFITTNKFRNDEKFLDKERTMQAKEIYEGSSIKTKDNELFTRIPLISLTIKKISKSGLKGKNFSESKYVNLFLIKNSTKGGSFADSNIVNALYISEIAKVIFPEFYYKTRNASIYDYGGDLAIMKIEEFAKEIRHLNLKKYCEANSKTYSGETEEKDKRKSEINNLNLDRQSIFNSIAFFLFCDLGDRSYRNLMFVQNDGFDSMFNIDFDMIAKNEDSFKNFFFLIQSFESNKEKIINLLIKHVYRGNHKLDDDSTRALYNKLFENTTQNEINSFAKSFLSKFNEENMEKIKKINEIYERSMVTSRNRKNQALSNNIELIDSVVNSNLQK